MLHGWPSTHLEWIKVIPGLVEPLNASLPAFHTAAPDIPGYGFSPAPTAPGLGASELATVFVSLMKQLGYDRFAVYSTDVGYAVAIRMAVEHPAQMINHATDFYMVFPNTTDIARYTSNQTTPEESRFISAINYFSTYHTGYSAIQSTLPLSIAYALNDSPVGFLAWVWQLAHTARDVSVPQSLHEIVTQAFKLYIPGVYSNIRSYREIYSPTVFVGTRNSVPTIVTQWGAPQAQYPEIADFNYVPRDWVERTANVTYFRRLPVGGHFPAVDQPELWLDVIREAYSAAA